MLFAPECGESARTVAKDKKEDGGGETYNDVVQRLEQVVKRLEGGELSLEDSLKAFEEGIGLVRTGERLLKDAEKRVEELLQEDGELKTQPLAPGQGAGQQAPSKSAAKPAAGKPASKPAVSEDEDVPF